MLLLLPLLMLSLAALVPVEADLKCYDCLSKSIPDCADDSKAASFDQITCPNDEKLCSVLVMRDSSGDRVVSRQCTSSPNEAQQLKNFIRSVHSTNLTVTKFEVCNTDLCNVTPKKPYTPSYAGSNSAASSFGLLSVTLGALATSAAFRRAA